MCAQDDEHSRLSRLRSRRRFLSTAGVVAATAGLAGCSDGGVTNYEFRADPVELPDAVRSTLDYQLHESETATVERSRTISGVDVTATVESQVAVYASGDVGDGTAASPDFGVVSTPEASVMGRSFNPLASRSLPNLLTSEVGMQFLQQAGLDEVGHSRDRLRWDRGPTFLEKRAGTCLDAETTLESYAGVLAGDPPSVAFVHIARVRADSFVIPTAIHGQDIDRSDRPFVDAENGYRSPEEFDEAVGTYADATAALRYEE